MAFMLALVVGCAHVPATLAEGGLERASSSLTQSQVRELATDFKAVWLKQNPDETELMGPSTVLEVKATSTGWHVTFERVTLLGQPEGESHHFLHVYIDLLGQLEKIVRGPDEIT